MASTISYFEQKDDMQRRNHPYRQCSPLICCTFQLGMVLEHLWSICQFYSFAVLTLSGTPHDFVTFNKDFFTSHHPILKILLVSHKKTKNPCSCDQGNFFVWLNIFWHELTTLQILTSKLNILQFIYIYFLYSYLETHLMRWIGYQVKIMWYPVNPQQGN